MSIGAVVFGQKKQPVQQHTEEMESILAVQKRCGVTESACSAIEWVHEKGNN